jgi:hypothetical protein
VVRVGGNAGMLLRCCRSSTKSDCSRLLSALKFVRLISSQRCPVVVLGLAAPVNFSRVLARE